MSYMGKVDVKASDIKRFSVTGSTSATHALSWTAPSEQALIITINGVKQQDGAYTIAGTPTTITLSSALVATDEMEVIGINDIGQTNTVAQDSIVTDMIRDDVVTAAKLNTTGTASASTFLRGDMAWATPTDQGKVLQVVNATYGSQESTTSTSFVATSLTASITPSSTSNKILVFLHMNLRQEGGNHVIGTIYRDTTNLGDATWGMGQSYSTGNSQMNCSLNWLDSPSTTSSTTYTLYFRSYTGAVVYSSVSGETGSITLIEIEA